MKTTPQLRGGSLCRPGFSPWELSQRSPAGTGDQAGNAGKLISISNGKPVIRRSSPRTLDAGDPLDAPPSAPLSATLGAMLVLLTSAPAVPFPPRHRGQAVPRARSCPHWVSPVPALCSTGPAAAAAPSPSAWLGRSFFWPLLLSSGI